MIPISRARAAPSAWTFTIKPIRELVDRYVGNGTGWIDPFAGNNSPAEFTNDQHPHRKRYAVQPHHCREERRHLCVGGNG